MSRYKYSVYVKLDSQNRIIAVNSSAFLKDIAGWIKIAEGYGDKYHHAQGHFFEKSIVDEQGAWRYKLDNDVPRECTLEEITEQITISIIPKAPRNIVAGEYITVNGILYMATLNIPNDGNIIVGQNAIATTVEEQLYKLTKGE